MLLPAILMDLILIYSSRILVVSFCFVFLFVWPFFLFCDRVSMHFRLALSSLCSTPPPPPPGHSEMAVETGQIPSLGKL